jgi:phosphoribosylanthranilate isomerase
MVPEPHPASAPRRPRVKICCVSDRAERDLAIAVGAAAVGLVSAMPSGPGVIADDLIRDLAAGVPPGVDAFLLTSRTSADEIVAQARAARPHVLQIVEPVSTETRARVRAALPGVRIVQVLHVGGEDAVAAARDLAREADALLLDSGNVFAGAASTEGPRRELGGTGRVHDWSVSRRVRDALDIPVFLAGGLHAGNVAEAIARVRPYGVDVCSGVRTRGRLDAAKLTAFVAAASAAILAE